MSVDIIEQKKDRATLLIKDLNAAQANALRRVMIEEVPTLAIEDIEFHKNNTVMYDEIMAHRLGLIPLTTDLKSYMLPSPENNVQAGDLRTQTTFVLKAKGPMTVTAGELAFKDPAVKPVYPDMLIVNLLKGQEIEITGTAVLGIGKVHMKWAPGHVYYRQRAEVSIIKDVDGELAHKLVESCPVDIFAAKGNKASVVKDKVADCILCMACRDLAPAQVKVTETTDYYFFAESWGQLSTKTWLTEATKVLQSKMEEFQKKLL